MNGTGTYIDRAMSALQAPKAEAPGTDIEATLARIAEALEKQNVLTEELASSIDYVAQAIFHVGNYL